MRSYQVIVVVKTGSDTERKKTLDVVKGFLKGLKVTKEEDLGSKALSYKIKGELSGHYYDLTVEGEDFPKDFSKRMLETATVLRELVLRK